MYSTANSPSRVTAAQERHEDMVAACQDFSNLETWEGLAYDLARMVQQFIGQNGVYAEFGETDAQRIERQDRLQREFFAILHDDDSIGALRVKARHRAEEPFDDGRGE